MREVCKFDSCLAHYCTFFKQQLVMSTLIWVVFIVAMVVAFGAGIYEVQKRYSKTEEEKRQDDHEKLSRYLSDMSEHLYHLAREMDRHSHPSFSDQAPEVRAVANEIDKLRQRNEEKYSDASPKARKSRDSRARPKRP